MASNKRQKTVVDGNGEDIFSTLPDCVLSHIFSFLPTKDVVRTSVLSKRWEFKWTCMTSLSVDDSYASDKKRRRKQSFIHFMSRVFDNLSSKTITSFTLNLSTTYKEKDSSFDLVSAWIYSALYRKVQKLCVQYFPTQVNGVSVFLFQITTLVHLELDMACNLIVPSSNCFKNLEILKVSTIQFIGNLTNTEEMVLNFPVLKLLEAESCMWSNVNSLTINAPLLENCSFLNPVLAANPENMALDENNPLNLAIKIFAPHLRILHYSGLLQQDIIILSNPSSVVDVCLDVQPKAGPNFSPDELLEKGVRASKFLAQFRRVEYLKLSCYTIQVLAHDNDYVSSLPAFRSLVQLELDLNVSLPSQQILFNILHKSPILEKLAFISELTKIDQNLLTSEEVPRCILSTLRDVEIGCFDWDENNHRLAKYILEKARVLEKLTISTTKPTKRAIRRQLLSPNIASMFVVAIEVEKATKTTLYHFRESFKYLKLH